MKPFQTYKLRPSGKEGITLKHVCVIFALIATFALAPHASAQAPKKPGQTIFGEDRKATMKAMRGISKALGEKCTYCHVKEGGKVVYTTDTPHKQAARQMKSAFIDSLVANGQAEASFDHHGKSKVIKANYTTKGDDAGIHLVAQEGEGEQHTLKVSLPKKGEALNCKTCHGGRVHILAKEEKK